LATGLIAMVPISDESAPQVLARLKGDAGRRE
jgi:hypothetical protein